MGGILYSKEEEETEKAEHLEKGEGGGVGRGQNKDRVIFTH